MEEAAVKLRGEALKAIETIRGNRNESVAETLNRALSLAEAVAKEIAAGATVQFKEQNGSVRVLADE